MTKPRDIVSGAAAGAVLAFAALSSIAAVAWVFRTVPAAVITTVIAAGVLLGGISAARRDRDQGPGDAASTRFFVIPGDD